MSDRIDIKQASREYLKKLDECDQVSSTEIFTVATWAIAEQLERIADYLEMTPKQREAMEEYLADKRKGLRQ